MRTIGNIERFLVIGIVVVIGAILAVAIKGADDLEGAYNKKVQAKSFENKKGGGTPLSKVDPVHPAPGPVVPAPVKGDGKGDAVDRGALGTDTSDLSRQVQNLLNGGKTGDAGHPDATAGGTIEKPDPATAGSKGTSPAPDPGGATGTQEGDASAPVVIKEDPKAGHEAAAGTPVNGKAAETPVNNGSKSVAPPAASLDWTYEVQAGDRLERVASTLYGDRSMWKSILAANPAYPDPTHIRTGSVLVLPKAPINTTAPGLAHGATKSKPAMAQDEDHHVKAADDGHAAATTKPVADETKSTTYKRVTNFDQYEVQKGDTLMAIAATHYGTRAAWRMILGANTERITDKDHIKPGTVLKLPAQ